MITLIKIFAITSIFVFLIGCSMMDYLYTPMGLSEPEDKRNAEKKLAVWVCVISGIIGGIFMYLAHIYHIWGF